MAAVVKAALLNADAGEERMRLQVQEAALNEIPVLERRIGALAAAEVISHFGARPEADLRALARAAGLG